MKEKQRRFKGVTYKMKEPYWEQQDYENNVVYKKFCYYRDQNPVDRTLKTGIINYLMVETKLSRENAEKAYRKHAPLWTELSNGNARNNVPINGAMGWYERVQHYDSVTDPLLDIKGNSEKNEFISVEISDFYKQKLTWDQIYNIFIEDINEQKITKKYKLKDNIAVFKTLVTLRSNLSDFGRRAMNLPITISEELNKGDNSLKIVWEDPKFDSIGVGAEKVEKAIKRLRDKNEQSKDLTDNSDSLYGESDFSD